MLLIGKTYIVSYDLKEWMRVKINKLGEGKWRKNKSSRIRI